MTPSQLEETFNFELGPDKAWFSQILAQRYCQAFKVLGGTDAYRTTYEGLAMLTSLVRYIAAQYPEAYVLAKDSVLSADLLAQLVLSVATAYPLAVERQTDIWWFAALCDECLNRGWVDASALSTRGLVETSRLWRLVCACYRCPSPREIDAMHAIEACNRMELSGLVLAHMDEGRKMYVPTVFARGLSRAEQVQGRISVVQ